MCWGPQLMQSRYVPYFFLLPCAIASRLSPLGKGGKVRRGAARGKWKGPEAVTCQKPGKCLQVWLAQMPNCGCMVQSQGTDRSGGGLEGAALPNLECCVFVAHALTL